MNDEFTFNKPADTSRLERYPVDERLPSSQTTTWALLFALPFLFVFFRVLIRTAWLSDDAYITFRTIDNFTHGLGLRWNVAERVQTFTHPLWMFLLSATSLFTGDLYYTTLLLSMALSVFAVLVALQYKAQEVKMVIIGLAIFTCSKAFVDYSTSGLENPLTHILLALFVMVFLTRLPSLGRLFALALLASLLTLNRMDTVLLCLPALVISFWQVRSLKAFAVLALGVTPFLTWEAFSLFYYGFPFPNTAYAKLGTGIEKMELWRQGAYYFVNSLRFDPLTLLTVAFGCTVSIMRKNWRALPITAGVALYFVYTVYIGGGFMSGRFFTAPLLCAVMLLAGLQVNMMGFIAAMMGIVTIGLMSPFSTLKSDATYGVRHYRSIDGHGIADERQFYYPSTGLLSKSRQGQPPTHRYILEGMALREKGAVVALHHSVGFRGYFAGPEPFIIDPYAIADPLLARLPARYTKNWRIGHFERAIPKGYVATLTDSENRIQDRPLAEYYDALRLITRGPLFSLGRLNAVFAMNLGRYDYLVDRHKYRYPAMQRVPLAALEPSDQDNSETAPSRKTFTVTEAGLEISLGRSVHSPGLNVEAKDSRGYRVSFFRDGVLRGTLDVAPSAGPRGDFRTSQVQAPLDEMPGGYDAIRFTLLDPEHGITLRAVELR